MSLPSCLSSRLSRIFFREDCRRDYYQSGFSLIEVVLAVGVVAFAFVALLGLLPSGMSTFRKAMDTSLGAQIGQKIVNDLQQTEFDTLLVKDTMPGFDPNNPPTTLASSQPDFTHYTAHRFFDDQGNEIVNPNYGSAGADPSQFPTDPSPQQRLQFHILYEVHAQISWPGSLPGPSSVTSPSIAVVRVQIANNPGGVTLPEDLEKTTAVSHTTFVGYISRNGKNPSLNTGS